MDFGHHHCVVAVAQIPSKVLYFVSVIRMVQILLTQGSVKSSTFSIIGDYILFMSGSLYVWLNSGCYFTTLMILSLSFQLYSGEFVSIMFYTSSMPSQNVVSRVFQIFNLHIPP